jgi:acyl-coenzyme A thioesterase PaaI-like protein
MRYLFTLYKKKSGNSTAIWHARFWDETLQRYAHSRTTGVLVKEKKERRQEA